MFKRRWFQQWLATPRSSSPPVTSPISIHSSGQIILASHDISILGPFTIPADATFLMTFNVPDVLFSLTDNAAYWADAWPGNDVINYSWFRQVADPVGTVHCQFRNNSIASATIDWILLLVQGP